MAQALTAETAEIAYSLLWGCDTGGGSLLTNWQRAHSSRLRAPEVGGSRHLPAGEEILNEGKTYTRQTHTHSQAYQMQARALHEGGRNAFAAFHYNPKA